MARLIALYWRPVQLLVRRRGVGREAADDLTQGFFTAFLERDFLRYVDPGRGVFRAFLLTALEHYLADEWDRARAAKRGAGRPHLPLDDHGRAASALASSAEDPERRLNRKWAIEVLGRALEVVREGYRARGCSHEFDVLAPRVCAATSPQPTYAELAARLGLVEHAVNNRLHRLRRQLRGAICTELRALSPADDPPTEALRDLFAAVAS
jgi:DNA-directed RNA polymerase specialized sigma24 family protein